MFRLWFWIPVAVVLIPSTLLHIKILLTIRKLKQQASFKSLFYRLFTVQSIIELLLLFLHLASQFLVNDQPLGGEFLLSTNGGFFPKFYYYGTIYFFLHVQVWGVMVQSFNRAVTVCVPFSRVKHCLDSLPDIVWCLIKLVVPLAIFARLLFQDETYFITNNQGNVVVYSPPHVIQSNGTQSTAICAAGTIFSAVCYAFILRDLIASKIKHNIREFRREKVLTLVGFALFLSLCVMTTYYLIITFAATLNANLVFTLRNFYIVPVMMLTFINSWMLAITSKNLRKGMMGTTSDSLVAITIKSTSGRA